MGHPDKLFLLSIKLTTILTIQQRLKIADLEANNDILNQIVSLEAVPPEKINTVYSKVLSKHLELLWYDEGIYRPFH